MGSAAWEQKRKAAGGGNNPRVLGCLEALLSQ